MLNTKYPVINPAKAFLVLMNRTKKSGAIQAATGMIHLPFAKKKVKIPILSHK
jgi:hypothetical protein